MTNKGMIAVAGIGALLALAGCTGTTHASTSDPTPGQIRPGTHTGVFQMPYGFRNVAFTCNGVVGIYVTSRGGSDGPIPSGISTVSDDPNCKG